MEHKAVLLLLLLHYGYSQVPPRIIDLKNVTVLEGDTVRLHCVFSGEPVPSVTFQKQGTSQPYVDGENEGGRVFVSRVADNALDLTIMNLSPDDTANYTCRAVNIGGEDSVIGTIIVEFKPRFDRDHIEQYWAWPGKTRNMTCSAVGEPEPVIDWYLHDSYRRIQNNESFRVYHMGRTSVLQVTVHNQDDDWIYGDYHCVAYNKLGQGRINIELKRARTAPNTGVQMSRNIINDDRQAARPMFSYLLHQNQGEPQVTHMLELKRRQHQSTWNDLSVSVHLKESNLAPVFQPVDHSDYNDNEDFYGSVTILHRYCPYPVPLKYELSMVMHQNVTMQAKYYNCDKDKREVNGDNCRKKSGYYLDPQKPCETYKKFGRQAYVNPTRSVRCTLPGTLSDKFSVSSNLGKHASMFVNRTANCIEEKANCNASVIMCAPTMGSVQGSPGCNPTMEERDSDVSSQPQQCFRCCREQACSENCESHYKCQCELVRCLTGNLAEFVLSPVFPNRGLVFACHVQPKPNYKIYNIEYTVLNKGEPVNNRTLTAQKYSEGHHPVMAIDKHDFLDVYYGSEVKDKVDFIEGDIYNQRFSSGYYLNQNTPVTEMNITSSKLFVQPQKPLGVSTEYWKMQDCDTNVLSKLHLATDSAYHPNPQLSVQYEPRIPHQCRIFNKTSVPFIYFGVPQNASILKPMFGDTKVKDDSTLKAELVLSANTLTLSLRGEIEECPGFFAIKITDPAKPEEPLAEHDVGVMCPRSFTIDFTKTPANDMNSLRVEITDTHRTIDMVVSSSERLNRMLDILRRAGVERNTEQ